MIKFIVKSIPIVALSLTLAACGAADRLKDVGKPPALSAIENPVAQAGYRPVQLPMPAQAIQTNYSPNSLWQSGARSFFKDQRARRVGDILTVEVTISDSATIDNSTNRSRTNSENVGSNVASINSALSLVPKGISKFIPTPTADLQSGTNSSGSGSVNRTESLETKIAAVVVQKLPNGNLVIEGKQEVRVNFEVRELIVAGIVRPEDIEADNTIDSEKIAQARISYGGRGQITDVQQPRYGQQVLDILLPF